MKPQSSSPNNNPSRTRVLIRLFLLLCFVAAPLIAQTASQSTVPKLTVVTPQLSQLNAATLQASGMPGTFTWHYGTVVGLGYFASAGGREVVIQWDQGGGSRQQGGISDAQWEIFKLAYAGSGRIAVLSDFVTNWQFDLRFLEAQR
jgi:hypothetical protein